MGEDPHHALTGPGKKRGMEDVRMSDDDQERQPCFLSFLLCSNPAAKSNEKVGLVSQGGSHDRKMGKSWSHLEDELRRPKAQL